MAMKRALDSVNERILNAIQRRQQSIVAGSLVSPRLVAVSKLKPASAIIEAYESGQRYFGENYIQELEEKSNSSEVIERCPDIKFHFIGHLQSNKVKKLMKVRNLYMMETVDSAKLADLIDKVIAKRREGNADSSGDESSKGPIPTQGATGFDSRLKVLIQVNTSGEEQKNGIQPDEAPDLAEHIVTQCKNLEFAGLMTIGRLEGWQGQNQDFVRLHQLRDVISKRLSIRAQDLELSMGMSGDFEEAIELGSTSVRVGTLIFGERSAKN